MARRVASDTAWLREALVERRMRLVERFDCPRTRDRLDSYVERVRSGAPLKLGAEELFLALHDVDALLAERFAASESPARRWLLDESNSLSASL